MRNALARFVAMVALLAPVLGAQSKPAGEANLTFDVVSVKAEQDRREPREYRAGLW